MLFYWCAPWRFCWLRGRWDGSPFLIAAALLLIGSITRLAVWKLMK